MLLQSPLFTLLRTRYNVTSTTLILLIAIVIPAFYNLNFWLRLLQTFEQLSLPAIGFSVMFFTLISFLVFMLLSLFNHHYLLKPVAITLLFSAASIAYFNSIGVVIDEVMIKNITETNTQEAMELANGSLLTYLLILGFIPAFFIARLKLNYQSKWVRLKRSSLYSITMALGVSALLYSNFQFTTFFGRENRDLRLFVNPLFPLLSVNKYASSHFKTVEVFVHVGSDAQQIKLAKKRTVGIFMLGETARADHFGINGYPKNTTPNLDKRLAQGRLFNFSDVTACGTSTAYSVPCIFSLLDEDNYSPNKARNQSNVLDILESAGIKTLWRDNNSSCKGVCARIENENFRDHIDKQSLYFHEGAYLDEILLSNLDRVIATTDKDILIVLHQLGSHGPAYHRRYPKSFAKFSPSCASNAPQNCTPTEVSNSYDNTIVYTDYLLEKTITLLEEHSQDYQSFMLYVSDHGESLGENGVYLHGLPKVIAPKSQTHVPLVLWLSDDMYNTFGAPVALEAYANGCVERELSHDHISHTLLAIFNVETSLKKAEKSIINNHCLLSGMLAKEP
ncbi:lipid A ethanolaminephosphotransferase [Marinagarivorans cellulosilyticus]|uniref:Lipid A ethanolaminephosphotransferase n=2 Tax=Marinagarivorans cellulosilyticus TaxID=2721545 RepID=A0AAN1WF21_9GAMM|nr:lipid A ethanolaminephosphotransferase [Marinagarivorans cellulosilyticus]